MRSNDSAGESRCKGRPKCRLAGRVVMTDLETRNAHVEGGVIVDR